LLINSLYLITSYIIRKSALSFFLNTNLVLHSINRISPSWGNISKGLINDDFANIVEREKSLENIIQLESGEIRFKSNQITSVLNDSSLIKKCDEIKKEYMTMMDDIHSLLINYEDLSINQKLEYCNSERYYMRMYMRHALIKINKVIPD